MENIQVIFVFGGDCSILFLQPYQFLIGTAKKIQRSVFLPRNVWNILDCNNFILDFILSFWLLDFLLFLTNGLFVILLIVTLEWFLVILLFIGVIIVGEWLCRYWGIGMGIAERLFFLFMRCKFDIEWIDGWLCRLCLCLLLWNLHYIAINIAQ